MNDKIITIGIGVYKRNKSYINHTLSSIIQNLQIYNYQDKIKILIVNDCQYQVQDFLIAKQYKQKYNDLFQLYDNKCNKGIAFTYNKMIQICNTQFFLPFDSDDYFYRFNIVQQCDILKQNIQYCGSYGIRGFCNLDSGQCGDSVFGYQHKLQDFINFNCGITHNAMVLKTQDAKLTGNYLPNYLGNNCVKVSCDFSMFVSMLLYKDLLFRNQVRVLYNEHQQCFHMQKVTAFPQEFKTIANGVVKYSQENNFSSLNMHPLYYSAKKFLSNPQFYIKNSWLGVQLENKK